jgi:hypothetical protein
MVPGIYKLGISNRTDMYAMRITINSVNGHFHEIKLHILSFGHYPPKRKV